MTRPAENKDEANEANEANELWLKEIPLRGPTHELRCPSVRDHYVL